MQSHKAGVEGDACDKPVPRRIWLTMYSTRKLLLPPLFFTSSSALPLLKPLF